MASGSSTRERLIRTTGRLLRQQGYAATGLNQVMAEADAPKGSMYFHFPGGKQELAAAAVDRFAERSIARMAERLAAASSVSEAVAGILGSYVEHLEKTEFREGCPVATVALEAGHEHEDLGRATDRALRAWTKLIADALEAEGRHPDEAHRLATLVIATIEGSIVMAKGQRSAEPVAATREALRSVLAR